MIELGLTVLSTKLLAAFAIMLVLSAGTCYLATLGALLILVASPSLLVAFVALLLAALGAAFHLTAWGALDRLGL
jgi:hypothetical protein